MFHIKKIIFEVSVPVDKASYLIIPRLCEGGKIRAILGQFSARELVVFFKVAPPAGFEPATFCLSIGTFVKTH